MLRKLISDRRGAALVEAALALPVMAVLMVGMLAYGQYFLLAHAVQQFANDAARATVAGLTPTERRSLVSQSVSASVAGTGTLVGDRLTWQVSEAAPWTTVRLRYDAGDAALIRNALVPMPSPVIERSAVVRQGGYS